MEPNFTMSNQLRNCCLTISISYTYTFNIKEEKWIFVDADP